MVAYWLLCRLLKAVCAKPDYYSLFARACRGPPCMKVLYGAVAFSYVQLVSAVNGLDQIGLGLPGGLGNIVYPRQQGCQRGRQRAARAVRIAGLYAPPGKLDKAVEIGRAHV